MSFFSIEQPIRYEGPNSDNPLAYRYYDPQKVILGKSLEEHLRFAVCYWHNFVWPGSDPFGGQTFDRPWFGNEMSDAKHKADVAFEMFRLLGVPYFCFHDLDMRPEGANFAESVAQAARVVWICHSK